ncbi:DUF2786 domain-containing protein [Hydrogenoanaerobacterium sp.]|uniref:DUF2786 domain-containing protein n=1 Tax=Hydrogenoanaerobacterium sp. TaxID=2953763 RepID=UPI002896721B|nr:DUF2786 domain-containing protein [Hydrogenoanaerobacterium sp.]
MDIKDKIAKLLALAESPNENEARAAMLKAKELMVQHKLTLSDLKTKPDAKVIQYLTGVTCSKRRDAWIIDLCGVIARNYCCKSYWNSRQYKQTVEIGIVGFEEDVQICNKIFHYALDCVNSWIQGKRLQLSGMYDAFTIRSVCDSYAKGFIQGISAAYLKQEEQHQEWGLVVITPKEVQEVVDGFRDSSFKGKSAMVPEIYNHGFSDGMEFNPADKLESPSVAV